MKFLAALLLMTVTLGGSCKKNSGDDDKVPPVVTITSPVSGHVYAPGEDINIVGTMTDDKFIAEAHIHIMNLNNSQSLMDVHIYPNGTSATFNQSILSVINVNYMIQVIAIDRSANKTVSRVDVSCR